MLYVCSRIWHHEYSLGIDIALTLAVCNEATMCVIIINIIVNMSNTNSSGENTMYLILQEQGRSPLNILKQAKGSKHYR